MELYDTGIIDAMYLAGLVADGERMTKKQLNAWADGAGHSTMISESTVPLVAAESAYGLELAIQWMGSKKEHVASCGWCTYSRMVAALPDDDLDLEEIEKLLEDVAKRIDRAPNRVRYTMNGFVIAVGSHVKPSGETGQGRGAEDRRGFGEPGRHGVQGAAGFRVHREGRIERKTWPEAENDRMKTRATSRRELLLGAAAFSAHRMFAQERAVNLDKLLSLFDYQAEAEKHISHGAWERIMGASADELTMKWNHEAYEHIRLKPRVLNDVSKLDTRVKLFGQEMAFPIILAPTGAQKFVHPEGDLASVRGAAAAQATICISSSASMKVEDIAHAATGPVWFQLYVQKDRAFTKDLVQRAEGAGCRGLCVTVDSPTFGARNREDRAKDELPARELPNLKGKDYLDPTLSWKDIEWLRGFAKTPIMLKGILNPDDAAIAVKTGIAGIIVSNHGARNLDTVPATIDALPLVIERVEGRVPVIVDGGIRRGTDVIKALARGAAAVQIGRPYLWGLGVAGAEGVTRVVNILRREFEMAMMLMGRPTLASIDKSALW